MIRTRWCRWLIVVLCGALSTLWLLLDVSATAVSAATFSGKVTRNELRAYCRDNGYAKVTHIGKNAYGWRCVGQRGGRHRISMLKLCKTSVNPKAIDRLQDFHSSSPRTWQCWRTSRGKLGGVNLDGYCRSIGYLGTTLVSKNAYGWRCVPSSEGDQLVGINMRSACQWQYNAPKAIDRMGNYHDPYSWKCWS
jgi:hypothetical protein